MSNHCCISETNIINMSTATENLKIKKKNKSKIENETLEKTMTNIIFSVHDFTTVNL